MKRTRKIRNERRQNRRCLRRFSAATDEVNILPLIDVLFLLLAFFIVLTTSMVIQKGVSVDLAHAETGETTTSKLESITISIDESSQLFLDKTPVSDAELLAKLTNLHSQNEKTAIILNADKLTTHQKVVLVLDAIRNSGFSNVTMTVSPSS